MNGLTIQQSIVLGQMAATWSVVGTGNFNGDGMGDVLWRDCNGDLRTPREFVGLRQECRLRHLKLD